ncbi:MAG: hypothetical protein EOT05_01095 [Candidatus Microsaccharimonas sossegonensis]|uniref:Uncharacterized protein n=1 Tax=Candidatus Microsaccharimonas sossegonensis TaxID=2506948 RepID=A0A4Q0AGQ5_9BACT|nr:MAG: hypothetical protein EOT05_01095 [Candidatus Microsaccharimonas sossegonensis]
MKKTQNKTSVFKKIATIIVLIFLAVLLFVAFAYLTKIWPFNNNSQNNLPVKIMDSQKNATKDTIPAAKDTTTKTTDQVPVNATVTATIDELFQSNGKITFKATVQSSVVGGKCSVTFTNPNDKPVVRTFNATAGKTVTVCGPVEIPEQEFTYLGQWDATFRYYINDGQITATKVITIQ